MFSKAFGAFGKLVKAKDSQIADKIENDNIVEFAKQDVEKIQQNLATVQGNIGKLKGRIQTLTEDIAENEKQIVDSTDKAKKLLATGKSEMEDLAKQHCANVSTLQTKNETLKTALKQQQDLLARETTTKTKLDKALQQCRQDLDIMKTEKEVADANKSLASVNINDSASAVQKFHDKRRILHEQLSETTAIVEETTSETLEEKTAKALGDEPGNDLFAQLKAQKPA